MKTVENKIMNLVLKYNKDNSNHSIVVFDFVSLNKDEDGNPEMEKWLYCIEEIYDNYNKFVTDFIGTGESKRSLIKTEYDKESFLYFELGESVLINSVDNKTFKYIQLHDPIRLDDNFSNKLSDRHAIEAYEQLFKERFKNGSTMWVSLPHTDNKNRKVYSAIFSLFNYKITDKSNQLEAYKLFRDFIVTYLIEFYKEPIEEEVSELAKEVSHLQQTKEDFANTIVQDYSNFHIPKIWKDKLYDIAAVFKTKHPILIFGETGTGKEIIAGLIHKRSNEPPNNFMALNCAGYTGDDALLESQLFGIGAYVATEVGEVKGLFEMYQNGGTIFFDEIQQMPLKFQMKLKRVIQEKKFTKRTLEGTKEITTNVRLIFATNVRPQESFKNNQLLEDFYYRINTFKIDLPSLGEMKEEIDHFIYKLLENINKEPSDSIKDAFPKKLQSGALNKLRNHHYGGNIRELENTIRRACFISKNMKLIDEKYIEFDDEIIKQNELDKELDNIKNSIKTGESTPSKRMSKAVDMVSKIVLAKKDLERNNIKVSAENIAKHEYLATNPEALLQALKRHSKEIKTIKEYNPSLRLASIQQISTALKKHTS